MTEFDYQFLMARSADHEQYIKEIEEKNRKSLLINPPNYDLEEIRSLERSLRVTIAELRIENLEARVTNIEKTLETLNKEFSEGIERLYAIH